MKTKGQIYDEILTEAKKGQMIYKDRDEMIDLLDAFISVYGFGEKLDLDLDNPATQFIQQLVLNLEQLRCGQFNSGDQIMAIYGTPIILK